MRRIAWEEVEMSGYEFPECGVFVAVLMQTTHKLNKRFGDVDNHLKAILDALRGVLYPDDSPDYLVGVSMAVRHGESDLTEIICVRAAD